MKLYQVAFAAGISLIAATQAQAEIVFRGAWIVTAEAGICDYFAVGNSRTARFHPNIAGNSGFAGLTTIYPFGSSGYQLNGASFTAAFKPVLGGSLGWGIAAWNGSEVRITQQIPAAVGPATRSVYMKGQIKRPDNDPGAGCIISFEASLVREP